MGSGVDATGADLPFAAAPPHPAAEVPTDERIAEYLRALGVHGALEIDLISTRVRARTRARAAEGVLENPLEAAIEEAHALLLEWLADELGIEDDRDALMSARAAVLGAAVPGWAQRWAGVSGVSVAPAIRAALLSPVPDPAPLTMDSQVIELCCHGLGTRLARLIPGMSHKRAGSTSPDPGA